jgi:hypothetical protein
MLESPRDQDIVPTDEVVDVPVVDGNARVV